MNVQLMTVLVAAGETSTAQGFAVWAPIIVAFLAAVASVVGAVFAKRSSQEAGRSAVLAAREAAGGPSHVASMAANVSYQMRRRELYGQLLTAIQVHEEARSPETLSLMLSSFTAAIMVAGAPLKEYLQELRKTLKSDVGEFNHERYVETINMMIADANQNR